ncbi:MAG: hypothetical protein AAGI13_03770 [Pseudomonadota bacterium]
MKAPEPEQSTSTASSAADFMGGGDMFALFGLGLLALIGFGIYCSLDRDGDEDDGWDRFDGDGGGE